MKGASIIWDKKTYSAFITAHHGAKILLCTCSSSSSQEKAAIAKKLPQHPDDAQHWESKDEEASQSLKSRKRKTASERLLIRSK
ncbi:uncharacterized protein LOC109807938 isoform X2 [Cajanus cajan]|nr:uncharacterized protein LOC109807938 isoform X2 [Cajanus cajan]